ncbi:MAG: hypothetical protein AAF739_17860 [Pseudomonadota bacterium]
MAFDAGFFNDADGDGRVELSDVLDVWEVDGTSWLVADTKYYSLQAVAHLGAVDKQLIESRIEDRSILNFEEDDTELFFFVDWGAKGPLEDHFDGGANKPLETNIDWGAIGPVETHNDWGVFAPAQTTFDVDYL